MINKPKFKSEFLNEQLSKGYLEFSVTNGPTNHFYTSLVRKQGRCEMVTVFPNNFNPDTYFYDRNLKNKMLVHLKKEGFVYSSLTGMSGYYVREIQ
jgi:hypothetical protein